LAVRQVHQRWATPGEAIPTPSKKAATPELELPISEVHTIVESRDWRFQNKTGTVKL